MIGFSVVIPVYNVEQYLDECIRSVVNQTYRNFEIILVNDGSTDNSGKICDTWADTDSRIRVIHQKNGGLSVARNSGIAVACKDYVMFLDSDDWWKEQTVLEKVALRIEQRGADVLSFDYQKSYDNKLDAPYFEGASDVPTEQSCEGSLHYMVKNDLWVTGACNKAVRLSLIKDNELLFREGITAEDIDWTLRLALCAEKFDFLKEVVFVYRQRILSISGSGSPKKTECLCDNVCECERLLSEAEQKKANILKPFVAYQYGTLLHSLAILKTKERSKELMTKVRKMRYLLEESTNSKVRMLRTSNKIFGFNLTLLLLKSRHLLQQMIARRV